MHRFLKWRDALHVAPNEKTVLSMIRDYVGAIDPAQLGSLPSEAQRALDPKMDLQSAAVMLLHCELGFSGNEELAQLLHEMAHIFAAASIRLTRLRTEPIVPAPK
jgi:hypothetical protein